MTRVFLVNQPTVWQGFPENAAVVSCGRTTWQNHLGTCFFPPTVQVLSLTPPCSPLPPYLENSSGFIPPPCWHITIDPMKLLQQEKNEILSLITLVVGKKKKTANSLGRDPSSLMLEAAAAPCWSRQEEVTPADPLCGRGGLILTRGLSARWTAESYIKNSWQVQRVENSRKTSIERSQHFFILFYFFDKQNQSSRSTQRKPSGAAHIHPQWLISGTALLYVGLRYPLYVFFFFQLCHLWGHNYQFCSIAVTSVLMLSWKYGSLKRYVKLSI